MNKVGEIGGVSRRWIVDAVIEEVAARTAGHDLREGSVACLAFGRGDGAGFGDGCGESWRDDEDDGNIDAAVF